MSRFCCYRHWTEEDLKGLSTPGRALCISAPRTLTATFLLLRARLAHGLLPTVVNLDSAWKEIVRKGPCQPANYQIFLVKKSCLHPDGGKGSPCQSMCGPEMKAEKPVCSVLAEERADMASTLVQSGELCQLSGYLLGPGVASTLCSIHTPMLTHTLKQLLGSSAWL